MRSSRRSSLWMLFAASLLGGAAWAQTGASPPTVPAASAGSGAASSRPAATGKKSRIAVHCKDETVKFCSDAVAGAGRLAACLRSHEAELSEACHASVLEGRARTGKEALPACPPSPPASATGAPLPVATPQGATGNGTPMKRIHQACGADVERFCKDVPSGRGRVAICLNAHASELSAGCKPFAQDVGARMNARVQMHADCAADIQKLCADMPAGPGRTGFCLSEHAAQLSAVCKKHVDEMKARPGKGGKVAG